VVLRWMPGRPPPVTEPVVLEPVTEPAVLEPAAVPAGLGHQPELAIMEQEMLQTVEREG
jgi:hypothetical protein